MGKINEYFTPQQVQRAETMCRVAIGKSMIVRIDKNTTMVGVVDAAEPAYVAFRARSVYMVFSVDLLCGANKTRRNFKLDKLPS